MSPNSFYQLQATRSDGSILDFSELRGKVVLIVNVASLCGFAPQYLELQALYDKYGPERLQILGFPCNQFGNQEPSSALEVQAHVYERFHVTFSILYKVNVNGPSTHPVYQYLKQKKPGLIGFEGVRWNFEKFLIDKEGNVAERYPSVISPKDFEKNIALLVSSI